MEDFDQHRIFGQVVKSTYNMLSRALPKDEHFALALHILKEAHPELFSEKVNSVLVSKRNVQLTLSLINPIQSIRIGMGIIYHQFRTGR